jgi:anti-sigma factor RsiW
MTHQCEQCGAVRDNFAAYADGELNDEERAQVAACVEHCADCADAVNAQALVRQQLQTLKRRQALPAPPQRIWAGASDAWRDHDGRLRRRSQARFALVAACMLLLLFGTVWARLNIPHEFPVSAALRDFARVQTQSTKPECVTGDVDEAARWLRSKLHADLPPINLRLSRAVLVGADTVSGGATPIGRLLYRLPHGLVGVYLSPGGTQFGDLAEKWVEGEPFHLATDGKRINFYGWSVGPVGYGIATLHTTANPSLLIEAVNGSRQTSR